MPGAINDNKVVSENRSDAGGIARIGEGVCNPPAAIRLCQSLRGILVEIGDQDLILPVRLEQIPDNDTADRARPAEHHKSQGPFLQYHAIGRSLRLMWTCLVSRNSSTPCRLSSRP